MMNLFETQNDLIKTLLSLNVKKIDVCIAAIDRGGPDLDGLDADTLATLRAMLLTHRAILCAMTE